MDYGDSSPAGILVQSFLDEMERQVRGASLRIQLLLLQKLTLEELSDSVVKHGINGPAVWVAETFLGVFEILAEIPTRIRQSLTTAMLEAVASVLIDDPKDSSVVLTRQKALDGCKSLLTQGAANLATGGVTTQWRAVRTLRKVFSGVGSIFRFLGWAKLIEAIVLWLADWWAAVWDVGVKFVAALLLLELAADGAKDVYFPVLSQAAKKRPASRKVWTRERSNQR